MRVSAACIPLAFALALFSSFVSHADDSSDPPVGPLDEIVQQRTQCYLTKLRPDRPNELGYSAGGCSHFKDDEAAYFKDLTRTFCTQPQAFCETVNKKYDPRFVNNRCQSGSHGDYDLNQYLGHKAGTDGPMNMDRRLGQLVQEGWGCKKTVELRDVPVGYIPNEPPHPPIRRPVIVMSCSKDKMPPGLGCNFDSSKKHDYPAVHGEITEAQQNLQLYADQMHMNGDECEMTFSTATKGLPPMPAGKSFDDYKNGLTADQQKALASDLKSEQETVDDAFGQTGSVITNGKKSGFRMFAQMALAGGRGQRLKEQFELAKRGIRAYLLHLKPPAPKLVVDQIMNTQLMDVDAMTANCDAAADKAAKAACTKKQDAAYAKLEAGCYDPANKDMPTGQNNAFNNPAVPPRHGKVTVCPELLFSEDFLNPNGILLTLTHELGHSIDTCTMGQMMTAVKPLNPRDPKDCKATPPYKKALPDPADQKAFEQYFDRVDGKDGVASCLHSAPAVQPYSRRNLALPDVHAKVLAWVNKEADKKKFKKASDRDEYVAKRMKEFEDAESRGAVSARGELTEKNFSTLKLNLGFTQCGFDAIKPGGPLAQCNLGHWTPESNPGSKLINGLQHDQTGESFADMVAAGSVPYAMMLDVGAAGLDPGCSPFDPKPLDPICNSTLTSDPNLHDLELPERQAEVLTAVSTDFCELSTNTGKDEHPDGEVRISTIAANQLMRHTIGCEPETAKAPSPEFPTAACAAKLSPDDPSWGGFGSFKP